MVFVNEIIFLSVIAFIFMFLGASTWFYVGLFLFFILFIVVCIKVVNVRFFKVFFKSVMTFPFVILFLHTPSMMRAAGIMKEGFFLFGLMVNCLLVSVFFDFIKTTNLWPYWPYVGLFLVVLFVITFRQTAKNMEQDAEDYARCEAEYLEMQAKNPWGPYFGQPVDAANVNIELKNGKILWRVPASKLEELAEDVKEWMPIPPRL